MDFFPTTERKGVDGLNYLSTYLFSNLDVDVACKGPGTPGAYFMNVQFYSLRFLSITLRVLRLGNTYRSKQYTLGTSDFDAQMSIIKI